MLDGLVLSVEVLIVGLAVFGARLGNLNWLLLNHDRRAGGARSRSTPGARHHARGRRQFRGVLLVDGRPSRGPVGLPLPGPSLFGIRLVGPSLFGIRLVGLSLVGLSLLCLRLLRTGYVAEFHLPTALKQREFPVDTGLNQLLVGPGDLFLGGLTSGDLLVYRRGESKRLDSRSSGVVGLPSAQPIQ